jgi:3-deoxy-manno-octulosonate cytidylyltransferase (CMP-KDO synthetase)
MFKNKKIICVIPARLASHRFPEKMLSTLAGKPLLSWAWRAAKAVPFFDDVICAVDDQRLAACVTSFGAKAIMTSPSCQSGTERLIELATKHNLEADVFVNWQGDEPFISSAMIEDLLQSIDKPTEEAWTLKTCIQNPADVTAINIAKVVTDRHNQALYFSRSPIPCVRDCTDIPALVRQKTYFKHVGLYAFSNSCLKKMASLGDCWLEQVEKLEMLKLLDYGISITVHETKHEVFGIDTPNDLIKAEQLIAANG